ncbi:MAG: xanthine dehydrogenase family protein molybdopterin-binding subunit, partial [Defluviicoccus sp.]|nr:xanthine dehydrogenase family protein molybdopterin-binding subunit [Defluviicoccus sp.]
RLLTGRGRFSDDVNLPGQVYAAMARSPHAHARIAGIDSGAALAVPGVLAVLTGADLLADGLACIPHRPAPTSPPDIELVNRDGTPKREVLPFPLPADRARFVGEAVAMAIAETPDRARDGLEQLHVAFEPLPAVTQAAAACSGDAPLLWEDMASNVCIDADVGDIERTERAFAGARHVVRLETWIPRVTGVPMEPRAAVAAYDPGTGRYTLHAGGGGVVRPKRELAQILGVQEDRVRVVAADVGGNYGTRNAFYPEFALVAWAARRLGRPVKWTADRGEAFLSDYQGRDLAVAAELALDANGRFIAMRGSNLSNVGAHTVSFVPLIKGVEIMTGLYDVPAAHFRARAAVTNTPPTNPYRSAGRPEVMFVLERLVDIAAARHGFDRLALRRANLVPEGAMPFPNPLGMTYDSGDYGSAMDAAVAAADWDGFAGRRAESRARGRCRGIGIANYIETSTGAPRERAEITVRPEGRIDVVIGTLSSGQGHETSFAQLAAEWFGVSLEDVNLITGDTDIVSVGGGSHSGRSMRLAGITMGKATDEITARGRGIAAWLMEAAEEDIAFADGRFQVSGTDRSLGLFETARAAERGDGLPEELCGPLIGISDETVRVAAFPYGCHVCEVEVDPETGAVEILRYTGVDDVGRAINPMILHGQAHGSIAQGLGEAMMEQSVYDPASGQALAASFMDYAMPRADDLPSFRTEISEVPTPDNPLGIRSGGEGGTTPSLAAYVNAVVDALAEFGVDHLEMPVSPESVWRAIRAGA